MILWPTGLKISADVGYYASTSTLLKKMDGWTSPNFKSKHIDH